MWKSVLKDLEKLEKSFREQEKEIKKLKTSCWWNANPCPYSSGRSGLNSYFILCKECPRWTSEELLAVFVEIFPHSVYTEEMKDSAIAESLMFHGERLKEEFKQHMKLFTRNFADLVSEQAQKMMEEVLGKADS